MLEEPLQTHTKYVIGNLFQPTPLHLLQVLLKNPFWHSLEILKTLNTTLAKVQQL